MEAEIIKVGNYHKSGHNTSSIVDPDGIAPTVMENHGTITAVILWDDPQPDCHSERSEESVNINLKI